MNKVKKANRQSSPKPPSFRNPPKGTSFEKTVQELADFMDEWSGWNAFKARQKRD
jgi:hypothetical protein